MDLLLGRKPGSRETAGATAKPPAAGGASVLVKDVGATTFERDVINASMEAPVIVDFWAPWCGPCKQLGPLLEKAVTAEQGRIRMAKINIDENPEIAQALRIQSIPTVYAFYQGRPVDGFMGAVPESQIKQFIDKLLALTANAVAGDPVEELLAEAKEALAQGQKDVAAHIYGEILAADSESATARAGLARLLLESGSLPAARKLLDETPQAAAKNAEIAAARAALELAEQSGKLGASRVLAVKLEKNLSDNQIRFDLAMAYYAEGKREEAVETLLEIVRRDRAWNDDQARRQLVKLFEAFGAADPLTISARKRLSSILFS